MRIHFFKGPMGGNGIVLVVGDQIAFREEVLIAMALQDISP